MKFILDSPELAITAVKNLTRETGMPKHIALVAAVANLLLHGTMFLRYDVVC